MRMSLLWIATGPYVILFLVIQALTWLLVVGACMVAVQADYRVNRPYVP